MPSSKLSMCPLHPTILFHTWTKKVLIWGLSNLMSLFISHLFTIDGEEESKLREKEQKHRLEAALKMRDRYYETQKRWHEFREAERQRRIDKANRDELDYYAGVIAESQARREYATSKFKHMTTVRSHHQAAITIQRAFRQMKVRRKWLRIIADREELVQRRREERAARLIQRAWRLHKQYRLYLALNFKSVLTSPVITFSTRQQSPDAVRGVTHSYERSTSITGTCNHATNIIIIKSYSTIVNIIDNVHFIGRHPNCN